GSANMGSTRAWRATAATITSPPARRSSGAATAAINHGNAASDAHNGADPAEPRSAGDVATTSPATNAAWRSPVQRPTIAATPSAVRTMPPRKATSYASGTDPVAR